MKVLDYNRVVDALLLIELTSNSSNMGRKNMLFQRTKNSQKKDKNLYLKF